MKYLVEPSETEFMITNDRIHACDIKNCGVRNKDCGTYEASCGKFGGHCQNF